MRGKMKTKKRFTLVELLIVMSIIMVLMGLLLAAIASVMGGADKSEAVMTVSNLYVAIEEFKMDKKTYPAESGGNLSTSAGGLLESDGANSLTPYFSYDRELLDSGKLVDPWGQEYFYKNVAAVGNIDDARVGHSIKIFSPGPHNAATGSGDDCAGYYHKWLDPDSDTIIPIYKKKGN